MAESEPKAPDPKKYLYPGAEKDDAIIQQVETQIKIAFPASYTAGLVESAADAPVSKSEMDEQKAKYDDKVNGQRLKDPFKFDKEVKEDGPPPQPNTGAAVRPNIPQRPAAQHAEPKHNEKKGGDHKLEHKPVKHAAGGKEAPPQLPALVVAAGAAVSTGQQDLDKWLNGYPKKSPEANEKVSKIKEMGGIAKSFDSQVDGYVKKGNGFGETMKSVGTYFAGKKELNAIFGENPYDKVHGSLGGFMKGVSIVQNVVSIVGNVAGKLGMFLTIAGLFAMIFPPLGTLIEAIARIINIVGVICDVLGMALSGILVGLNGVVLAQQIAKGGSNEEKAATADNMMAEANAAGGHILNLAMQYGPKFMKGFQGASKGAIAQLFKRFKATIGRFASKIGGSVTNFAKNAAYKLGMGLEESGGPGRLAKMAGAAGSAAKRLGETRVGGAVVGAAKWTGGKIEAGAVATYHAGEVVYNAPGKAMEKMRGWGKGLSNSKIMGKIEAVGARMNRALDNSSFVQGMEGKYAEKLGEAAAQRLKNNEAKYAEEANLAVAKNLKTKREIAAQDGANRTNARLNRDIKKSNGAAADALWAGDADVARVYESESTYLERSRGDAVAEAEQGERDQVVKEYREDKKAASAKEDKAKQKETAQQAKEAEEKQKRDEYLQDPEKRRDELKNDEKKADKLDKERADLKKDLKNKNLSDAERAKKKQDLATNETNRAKARGEIKELRAQPLETNSPAKDILESPSNLKQLKETAGNISSMISNGQTEEQHKEKERDEWAEKDLGIAGREEKERAEQHHLINDWHEHSPPELGIAKEADDLLEGLDADLDEGDEHEHESDTDGGGDDNASQDDTGGVCEPPTQMSQASDSGDGTPSPDGDGDAPAAEPVQAAPAPKPEAKTDGGGELPELAYWPALVAPKGEFTTAHSELEGMKVYAVAFQNAQKSAKKKALEAADVWVGIKESTKHRSEEATKHAGATQQTVNSAGQSVASAQASSAKTDEGTTAQDNSKSNAKGEKQAVPSTGEKPGWTHPIKRFWWHLKTWAAEKTAAVMGWVQEKIASMVLAGICGVTMGQLKQYTEALHRRMDYSKGIGVSAIKKTDESKGKDAKNADFAHEQGEKALQDVAECDKNVADAATFMKDIEETQKQVDEEKERATTFMKDLHQQVKAERDKNPHGPVAPAQAAPSHTKAKVAGFATPAAVALVPGASMLSRGGIAAGAMAKKKEPAAPAKPLSPKAVARIKNAASFVGKKAGTVLLKLTETREKQAEKFEEKLAGRKGFDKVEVGESVVSDAKEAVGRITEGMAEYQARTPQTADDARAIAKAIRGNAESLEEFSIEANQSLNRAFKAAYEAADAA